MEGVGRLRGDTIRGLIVYWGETSAVAREETFVADSTRWPEHPLVFADKSHYSSVACVFSHLQPN